MKTRRLALAVILAMGIRALPAGAAETRLGELTPETATQGWGELQVDKPALPQDRAVTLGTARVQVKGNDLTLLRYEVK